MDGHDNNTVVEAFRNLPMIWRWTIGGILGGIVVGMILVSLHGWTLLSISFWLVFGLFVGALSGALACVIYRTITRQRA